MLPRSAQAPLNATVLKQPRLLPEFDLIDQDGHDYTRENMTGHWSLVFFGFTNCPDICPTTLNLLATVKTLLADLDESMRVSEIEVHLSYLLRDSSIILSAASLNRFVNRQ